jgi:hypothetical protein
VRLGSETSTIDDQKKLSERILVGLCFRLGLAPHSQVPRARDLRQEGAAAFIIMLCVGLPIAALALWRRRANDSYETVLAFLADDRQQL